MVGGGTGPVTHNVSTYDSYGSPITVSGVRPAEGSYTDHDQSKAA